MKKNKIINTLLNIFLTIGIILCLCVIAFKMAFIKVEIDGNSMLPTAYSTEEGYMLKMNSLRKINRFDIVAAEVNKDDENSRYWIKRILGLPNETVHLTGDNLYINGEIVDQPFTYLKVSTTKTITLTLKENEYFIIGDNREVSAYTVINKEQIIAMDCLVYNQCNTFNDLGLCEVKENGKWMWLR